MNLSRLRRTLTYIPAGASFAGSPSPTLEAGPAIPPAALTAAATEMRPSPSVFFRLQLGRTLPHALLFGSLALAATSPSAAATRSRTRHITPALTPLHYTERSFAIPKHGKTSPKAANPGSRSRGDRGKTAAGSRSRSAQAGAHPSGKHGTHRGSDSDYDAPVPMLRTGHGKGQQGRESIRSQRALNQPDTHYHPNSHDQRPFPTTHSHYVPSPSAPDTVVAEVTGRSAHGDTLAHLHSRSADTFSSAHYHAPVVVASAAQGAPAAYAGGANPLVPAPVERHAHSSAPYAPAPFNTGTAHPDDAARNPAYNASSGGRTQQVFSPGGPAAPLPTVQAPSPGRPLSPPVTPMQVVDGFGSELALAPALPSNHPGFTRRRNHPATAPPLSEDTRSSAPAVLAASLPSTLAERDAITAGAITPSILPSTPSELYDRDGRLLMPAPLRGSREVLVHQNTMADNDGLERIQNDYQLNRLRSTGQLVDLPASASLRINDNLPYNRRSARPWTALFTQDIARDFYARFHQPLWVTSAVRTVAFQSRLIRVNGNAAGLSGDFASPHLTGQAIDFGKHGMNAAQLAWMRSYLLPLIQSGKIDVEEEFQQACFHISVYRRYAGSRHLVVPMVQASAQPPALPSLRGPAPVVRPPAPPADSILTHPELTDSEQ